MDSLIAAAARALVVGDALGALKRVGLREDAKRAQRDPDSIALSYWAAWYKEGETLKLDDGQRRAFTGSDADVARDIAAFRALGVSNLLFNFARPTLARPR